MIDTSRSRYTTPFGIALSLLLAALFVIPAQAQPTDEGSDEATTESSEEASPADTDTDQEAAPTDAESDEQSTEGDSQDADETEAGTGEESTNSSLSDDQSEALGEMPEEDFQPPDAARGLAEPIPRPSAAGDDVLEEIDRFERALRSFESEVVEYRDDISRLVRLEYEGRRRDLHSVYDREIDTLRDEERNLRLGAIERLEEFVRRYPRHPPESPDAMFRLAELYFEKESDDFVAEDEEYARLLDLYDLGELPDVPDEPQKDYSSTVSWFQRVIVDFPDYRQVDGAHYLMGYALLQMGQEDVAVDSFRALVRDFPESDFAQEAWVRVGEYLFEYNEYEEAAAAYTRALEYGSEGRLYDEALFKLGWAHYLGNYYQESLDTFVVLINYYEEAEDVSGALREEALQYMAVVLAEEDWDIDGERDMNAGLPRVSEQLRTGKQWELDVLDRLTEVWFDNETYPLAIDGFNYAIENWPTDRKNPERHERIVAALSRMREYDAAFSEQLRFGELYGVTSEWYASQEEQANIQAMAYADELVRTTVLDSARYYNQQADLLRDQSLQNPALEQGAIDAYQIAATAYQNFLDQYPGDREAYEVRFLYAQALYYGFEFMTAAEQYEQVRALEGPRQELAGYQVVKSIEAALLDEIGKGALEAYALPTFRGEDDPDPDREEPHEGGPLPLHPLTETLIAAYDAYVELGLNPEDDPTTQGRFAFLAGKTYFDHNQMEDARARFQAMLDNPVYRAQEEALLAASLLIESYRMEGDFENMAMWATRISELDFGGDDIDREFLEQFIEDANTMRVGAAFLQAEQLFQGEQYEDAALEYVRLVNQNPQSEFAAAALNNAAVAWEREQRYEPAMQLYQRVVSDYPDCDFVAEALYRVAVNSRRFFDFERATNTYIILSQRDDVDEERARSALFAAAELQQFSGRFVDSAQTYEQFNDTFPDDENAPIALYRAGLMYERDERYSEMERVWRLLRRDFGRMTASAEIPIDAMYVDTIRRTADYYAEVVGDDREARRMYNDVLDEFFRRTTGDVESTYSAGKARFWLAENAFSEWAEIQIQGSVARQRNIVGEQIQGIPPLVEGYTAIIELNSAEWTLAAYYMVGRVYQAFADKLYAVPIPDEIADDEDLAFAYQLELEDVASRFEDEAVANWRVAMEVGSQSGLVNEWTISTIRELNRYLGSEFPLFKEEPDFIQHNVISPMPMMTPEGAARVDQPVTEDLDTGTSDDSPPDTVEDLDDSPVEDLDDGFEDFDDQEFDDLEPLEDI